MNENPKITIITSVYNGVKYLEETILSVINQTYNNVEYIIIDGGSTDGTIDIIKKYEKHLAYWKSEPDKGMYDGLRKGFEMATGDICAYINSDDFYLPHAFETVVNVFNHHPEVKLLTGLVVIYNDQSFIINVSIPYFPSSKAIKKRLFGSIQQESTFWRAELNNHLNWETFASFGLIGDYYIWYKFSDIADLYIVHACISGFRRHKNQLSTDISRYYLELKSLVSPMTVSDYFIKIYWKFMHKVCTLNYWRRLSNGRYLIWDSKYNTFMQ